MARWSYLELNESSNDQSPPKKDDSKQKTSEEASSNNGKRKKPKTSVTVKLKKDTKTKKANIKGAGGLRKKPLRPQIKPKKEVTTNFIKVKKETFCGS